MTLEEEDPLRGRLRRERLPAIERRAPSREQSQYRFRVLGGPYSLFKERSHFGLGHRALRRLNSFFLISTCLALGSCLLQCEADKAGRSTAPMLASLPPTVVGQTIPPVGVSRSTWSCHLSSAFFFLCTSDVDGICSRKLPPSYA